ncbi:MAG: trehalose-phosphatase [Planctomycetota bacterium]|nr:trehalose-phosphatase [Planctomycetota bacterium]
MILQALRQLARTPRLLVACDYDGVLAPIVVDPAQARPAPEALGALRELATLPQTDAAIISGRTLDSLRTLVNAGSGAEPAGSERDVPAGSRLELVGEHGAAWSEAVPARVGDVTLRLEPVRERLVALSTRFAGTHVEFKLHGLAYHYRGADSADVPAILEDLDQIERRFLGDGPCRVLRGRMVFEISTSTENKGVALTRLRARNGSTGVLFAGDDLTDEDAFAALGPLDVGVAVAGPRRGAAHEVADVAALGGLLRDLISLRRQWLREQSPFPLQKHSIVSDQRSIAVVDPMGSIAWLCWPRIDSPALFASLVSSPEAPHAAGAFSILPASKPGEPEPATGSPEQRYLDKTMVLETRWPSFRVLDYMDCSGGRAFQRAGRSDLVRVVEGSGRVRVLFAPRKDFGRQGTDLQPREGGLLVDDDPDPIVLLSPGVHWEIRQSGVHSTASAEVDLDALPTPGVLVLELRYGTASLRPGVVPEHERRDLNERFWSGWARTLKPPARARDAVLRSALMLKALVFGPTGAIAAAGTTSLPEWPGGVRNWDYRYCWPRDACLAAQALVRLGNTGHPMKLLDWMLGLIDSIGSAERLRPIYTVLGRDLGPEAEIGELAGYRGSRPVRVSNAAANQSQLDVFGPICGLVGLLADRGAPLGPDHWRMVEAIAGAVMRRWKEPDHGIWEVRGPKRHYTHSKLLCWHAMDQALRVGELLGGRRIDAWASTRDEIRDDILTHAFDERLGAFTLAYGLPELDAATLQLPLLGLLPPDDVRVTSTVRAIDAQLREGSAVYRYRFDDGLPGREGGFLICLGWLAEAWALMGERASAEDCFERLLACAGPTGTLTEQVDPANGEGLGNFPQAYSHLALINAALALDAPGATNAATIAGSP